MSDILEMDFDDFLAHHGVKGMRWGVRKKALPTPEEYFKKGWQGGVHTDKKGYSPGMHTKAQGREGDKVEKKYLDDERKRIASSDKATREQYKKDLKDLRKGKNLSGFEGFYRGRENQETSISYGKFKTHDGRDISEQYANVLVDDYRRRKDRQNKIAAGALLTVSILAAAQ